MKILIALSSLHSGGAERVACTLADAWSARGDEVIMLATFSERGSCFYRISETVRVIYLADLTPTKKRSLLNRVQRLSAYRWLLKEERPDVIVSFLPGVNVASVLASRGLGIPVIAGECTDPMAWNMPASEMLVYRLAYRHAEMLTVQTQAVADKIPMVFPRLKHLEVVPNPIPAPLQHFARPDLSASKRKRLIAMGRLSEEKQFALLIDVFCSVAAEWPDWDLAIFGEGGLREALERQIAGSRFSGRITLGGATSTPWDEMARSHAFVMTSRIEGFPNALLEAMAIGLPCAVFDCPSGPREITRDGTDALLVPLNDRTALADALRGLMSDDAMREELGSKARASVASRFSLQVVLDQYDRLFCKVGVRMMAAAGREDPMGMHA
ncbi:MAG TPA: glycosyltransferase family 4 protein [Noviherbaspirillum sp.]|uniref:glycosyltransferase family 4 protein n=1 Tax=Noviherbaspirillum sp. TaxID=1926288 RepID=UPI002D3C34C6|nr:glycosyltransferase family 4 protein [Noviherbaspirillum sp.]HYD97132.1 glycosyltransferase family 4 protein [Noviherbaspirillum sp.]